MKMMIFFWAFVLLPMYAFCMQQGKFLAQQGPIPAFMVPSQAIKQALPVQITMHDENEPEKSTQELQKEAAVLNKQIEKRVGFLKAYKFYLKAQDYVQAADAIIDFAQSHEKTPEQAAQELVIAAHKIEQKEESERVLAVARQLKEASQDSVKISSRTLYKMRRNTMND